MNYGEFIKLYPHKILPSNMGTHCLPRQRIHEDVDEKNTVKKPCIQPCQ